MISQLEGEQQWRAARPHLVDRRMSTWRVVVVDDRWTNLFRCSLLAWLQKDDDDDDDDDKDTPRTDRKRRGSLYIVLEYLEHDLAGLLDLNITRVFATLTLLQDI